MSTAIVIVCVMYFVGASNIMKLVKALKTCTNSVVNEIVDETTKEITNK